MASLSNQQSTLARLRSVKATVSIPDAGQFFGLSRPHSYRLAAAGEFPVPILKIGARMTVRTADLATALGVDPALLVND